MDGNEGLFQLLHQLQAEGQPHAQAEREAGHGGGRDGGELARRDLTGRQRFLHYSLDIFPVKLLSYWRNDPTCSGRDFFKKLFDFKIVKRGEEKLYMRAEGMFSN